MKKVIEHRHVQDGIVPDRKRVLRRFPRYFVPLSLVSIGLIFAIYLLMVDHDRETLETKERVKVGLNKELLLVELQSVLGDLLHASHQQALKRLVETGAVDDRAKLAQTFLSLSQYRSHYDQIRYLDEAGMEVVRVNYGNGTPYIVPVDRLQDKRDRYYFKEGIVLSEGEIYISPFDLNMENGQIETPIKPMIRFCTPVYDDSGVKKGLIVLNFLGRGLIERMKKSFSDSEYPSVLLNSEGYWLHSESPDQNWGFMYADRKDRTFVRKYPEEWARMMSERIGQFETDTGLYTFLTLFPILEIVQNQATTWQVPLNADTVTGYRDYYWLIVSHVSPEALAARTSDLRSVAFLLSGILLLCCAVIAWFWGRQQVIRRASIAVLEEVAHLKDSLITSTSVISGRMDLDDTLKVALQSARRLVEARYGALALVEQGQIVNFLVDGLASDEIGDVKGCRPQGGLLGEVLTRGESIRLSDLSEHPSSCGFPPDHPRMASFLGVPIFEGDDLLGSLYLTEKEGGGAFSEQDEDTLEMLANHVGAMIKKATLYEEIKLGAKIFDNSIEGICVTDTDGTIVKVNRAFTAITGYTFEEAIGKNPRILKSNRHDQAFYKEMWADILGKGKWEGEIWNRRKNGETYPEWLSIAAIADSKGDTVNYVAVFHDISEVKQGEEQLKYQAHHDALTGLPNRQLFNDRLGMALARARRHDEKLGVLFLDLDNFKHVNDTLGHRVGDLLLQGVAERISGCCREEDTVARIGGDEFIILMADLKDPGRDASRLARRIIDSLKNPFDLSEKQVMTQTSVGITLFPDDGDTTEDLIKNADMAMYKAKREGKNQYALFTDEMNRTLVRRVSLEADIRNALDRGEFEVHYQPKVDIDSSFVSGAEALVRWRRRGSEIVPPNEFIPLAEETGVIFELGTWVLFEACRQAQVWRKTGYGDLSVAVNLSPKQFRDKQMRQLVESALTETGLDAKRLTLEITENVMVFDVETTIATMESIAGLGVHWSIDDFGTGYSSMAYLQRLPLNELKIDKSFIDGIPQNAANSKIVESTLALAKGFGLKVVAEGVEEKEQVAFLAACHCNELQGYLISKPVPGEAFLEFLNQTREPFWMDDFLPAMPSENRPPAADPPKFNG